ncbi:hypothetical protein [Rhodohalobacter sp. SW132]|nr:hypothetical protein [Rhodohalobacter sp. SW132]
MKSNFYKDTILKNWFIMLLFFSITVPVAAQDTSVDPERVVIENGVMYWGESGEEVQLFGVNYYTPFSQTYRGLNVMRRDHKEAIDEDIYHLVRMGMDAFRTHMYEIEITDSLGNLLQNHHLDLHDYSLYKMKKHNIRTIITPTIYYGAGWPEGNVVEPPGFANYISKAGAPRNKEYWPVIQNYLEQVIHHVNPYTGLNMIDDPNIIAIEVDNEPSHSGYERTLEFVNSMANHLRESGWDKPIFYNITHGVPEAYLDADIDGVTFQWYPAGLYEQREKRSNYFPFVSSYDTPWEDDDRYQNMAKIVYEFDPADNLNNYAIPMSARSFREHGMQFAAHFAYTALGIAQANNDWISHYLNLVYTPGRAVSMMIAGEIFREIGYMEQFDDFPADTTFGDFLMSHHMNLSQMNSDEAFLYSNDTESSPRNEASLERIAGVGSSPVISYSGTGAYLLDKLESGVWRLEVFPDAIPVMDPFEGPADINRYVTHIEWGDHPMVISLSNLGESFSVKGLNEGNEMTTTASGKSFTVSPGTYLLTREGVSNDEWTPESSFGTLQLGDYHAVPSNADQPAVWHIPSEQAEAGEPLTISANVAGLSDDDLVLLNVKTESGENTSVEMEEVSPHKYVANIPAQIVNNGEIRYWIVIDREESTRFITFPGNVPSATWNWEDEYIQKWTSRVINQGNPILLWDAETDENDTFQGFGGSGGANSSEMVSIDGSDKVARSVSSTQPTVGRHTLGFSTFIGDRIAGITSNKLDSYQEIVVRAKTDFDNPADLKVILLDNDANAYSAPIPIDGTFSEHRIPLSAFEPDRFMMLPRAYPSVMGVWYETGVPGPVQPRKIEEIQFYIDTSENPDYEGGDRYGFAVEAVWLETGD